MESCKVLVAHLLASPRPRFEEGSFLAQVAFTENSLTEAPQGHDCVITVLQNMSNPEAVTMKASLLLGKGLGSRPGLGLQVDRPTAVHCARLCVCLLR